MEDESRLDAHLTAVENGLVDSAPLLESHAARFSAVARDVTRRRALICRLPNEVLREVLTIAIYDRFARSGRTEYKFAGVCGLWRQLVLDIRWPHFRISSSSTPTKIDAMWEFISQRLTHAPQHLHITNVHSKESGLLVSKQLSKILTLHKVQITLDSTHSPAVFHDNFQCSELSLTDLFDTDFHPPFPLAETLMSAQGIQKLYICTERPIELQAIHTAGFGGVVDLTLAEVDTLWLDPLLRAMPSLKKLRLERMETIIVELGEGQTTLVSAISTLVLRHVNTEWMTRLRCPDLTSLALDLFGQPNLVAFIFKSPRLKSFTVYDDDESFDLDILVPYFKNIEYLEIDRLYPVIGEWQAMGLPTPSFPNLKTLNIPDIYTFDPSACHTLISARCLPNTDPRSTRPPGLPPVELLFGNWGHETMKRFLETDEIMAASTRETRRETCPFSDDDRGFSVFKWS